MVRKAVLVRPDNIYGYSAYPPLNLLTIGTVLWENGYDVRIIDIAVQKDYKRQLREECRDAVFVGIGCCTSEVRSAIQVTDFIKNISNVPIVWGGWHPTLFPRQTCGDKNVDSVIIGEGDYSLLELARSIEGKSQPQDIRGAAYKESGQVIVNEPDDHINMDELPPVRYELIDISRYSHSKLTDYFSRANNVWLPYQSSRGCPHRCSFCINTVSNNSRYRIKSAIKVVAEVKDLVEKYGLTHLRIIDDNFFVDPRRVREICRGFVDSDINISWDAECRVDYFRDGHLDDDLLELCTKSGLVELTLGCESGSQRILDLMHKDIKTEQIVRSVEQCHKHNIVPRCSFMVGIPGENREDILLTSRLINKLRNIAPEMARGVVTFRPYPKSDMCIELIKDGTFKEPQTLREWATKKYVEYYTERTHRQPWQPYPVLAQNVSFFHTAAGGVLLANQQIKSNLLKRVNSFFIKLANKRIKSEFFGFPIDKYIYNLFYRSYFKWDTYMKKKGSRENA